MPTNSIPQSRIDNDTEVIVAGVIEPPGGTLDIGLFVCVHAKADIFCIAAIKVIIQMVC